MIVRRAGPGDRRIWASMLAQLHPGQTAEEFEREIEAFASLEQPYICFLAFTQRGEPIGMIDARVRNYAEGAPNLRAAYVEDVWVDPQRRREGAGKALLKAVDEWARGEGLDWLGSDTELANELGRKWHVAAGFEEVDRLIVFGKSLD